jgi:hypothetical protein
MKFFFGFAICLLCFQANAQLSETSIQSNLYRIENCSPSKEGETGRIEFANGDEDYKYGYSEAELTDYFNKVYLQGRRLKNRVFYDSAKHKFTLGSEQFNEEISLSFVKMIQSHIHFALKNKFVEHIFFSDMGHGHLYYPEKLELPQIWQDRYKVLLNNPSTKLLYHTAEELNFGNPQSRSISLEHRFLNRNLIATLDSSLPFIKIAEDKTENVNTVRKIGDYQEAKDFVLYLKANKNGCFKYIKDGEVLYFDLSL